jgi:hypothetical protein
LGRILRGDFDAGRYRKIGRMGRVGVGPHEQLLVHLPSNYRVDFESMNAAASMLDLVFQVERKGFISSEAVGHFITAIADIFDPQAHLCTDGREQAFNSEEKLKAAQASGFRRTLTKDGCPTSRRPKN